MRRATAAKIADPVVSIFERMIFLYRQACKHDPIFAIISTKKDLYLDIYPDKLVEDQNTAYAIDTEQYRMSELRKMTDSCFISSHTG